jgi:hypothetical protein
VPPPVAGGGAAQQLQAQGGQLWPAAQAGQAQAHPPPPLPGTGLVWVQTPVGQGVVTQAMPSSTQPQASAVSARHAPWSVKAAQGSAGTGAGGSGGVAQSHGGQALPAGQAGQVQAVLGVGAGAEPTVVVVTGSAVPLPVVPAPVTPTAPLLQPQEHGGQFGPVQTGQAHVQVPGLPQVPPPEPPVPPPPSQLQEHGGQV